jgi:hypothetical protein
MSKSITDLTSGSALGDADLIVVHQGTLDVKSTIADVKSAVVSSFPLATTATPGTVIAGQGIALNNGVISTAQKLTDGRVTTGLIIPSYIYPANIFSGDTVYHSIANLAKQYHTIPVIVILNPASGPGTVADGNYTGAIELLQGAGVKVFGYIHTTSASRAIVSVISDVATWKTLYPAIDGIWVDEFPQTASTANATDTSSGTITNLAYIQKIRAAALANNIQWLFGNQGSPSGYYGMAYVAAGAIDRVCIWENSVPPAASDLGFSGDWYPSFETTDYSKRISIIHDQATFSMAEFQIMQEYSSFIYYTDGGGTNPYVTISSYLGKMLSYLGENIATATTPGIVIASTGLSVDGNGSLTVNPSQNISTLSNLTTSGYVKTTAAGAISSGAIIAADVPSLDWSKLTTGVPTTVAGYGITDFSALSFNIIPAVNGYVTGNTGVDLGSPTKYFKNLYADEVHVGPHSLYVNGKQVISDNSNVMTFATSVDQSVLLTTTATAPGTGLGNLGFQAGGNLNSTTLGDTNFNVAATVGGKNINFTNSSAGGKINFNGSSIMTGDLAVSGNLTISGTTTQVNTTQLNINDNIITLNSNLTGTPPSTLTGGIEVNRGDSPKYRFQFDELTQSFSIGAVGTLQKVATREDTPISNGVPIWNAAVYRFDTTSVTISGSTITGSLAGNASTATKLATARNIAISGKVTGTATLFDGSAGISITTTAATLIASDIPSLDWSKITTGKPTTVAGYGITDAVNSVAAGSATIGAVAYNGTTPAIGKFDGSATAPADITTRINFNGNLYASTMTPGVFFVPTVASTVNNAMWIE